MIGHRSDKKVFLRKTIHFQCKSVPPKNPESHLSIAPEWFFETTRKKKQPWCDRTPSPPARRWLLFSSRVYWEVAFSLTLWLAADHWAFWCCSLQLQQRNPIQDPMWSSEMPRIVKDLSSPALLLVKGLLHFPIPFWVLATSLPASLCLGTFDTCDQVVLYIGGRLIVLVGNSYTWDGPQST